MNLEGQVIKVPIGDIIPNRFQPRLNFDERGLEELASSIKQHGIIQPLVLRRLGDKYEIIAGERRFKAANMAGLTEVPAVIANIDDNKSAEVAIVENVQRRDLSAIEEARSYKNLLDKGYMTQSELAKKMGISQSAIANKLRLLNLDESVQEALLNNEISERHARSLLVLENKEDQKKWLEKIIQERLTVRDLDAALKKLNSDSASTPPSTNAQVLKKITPKEVEEDIPLVETPDIDAIRNSATELPSLNEQSEIARKLKEIEREKLYNPDIIPVDQASNNAKGNFFNFLENETVNMNTEEVDLKTPVLNFDQPQETTEVETLNEEPQNNMAKENQPLDITPPVMPTNPIEPPKEETPNFNNNFGTPTSDDDIEDFDPTTLIDTLDPNYETKVEESLGLDLKTAINSIRETKDILSSKGFNISLEETDLNDTYQFTIKIKK